MHNRFVVSVGALCLSFGTTLFFVSVSEVALTMEKYMQPWSTIVNHYFKLGIKGLVEYNQPLT
jgi:hypothetical protein